MKILYHHSVASKGGQYVYAEQLTNALLEEAHELMIVELSSIGKSPFGGDSRLVSNMKKMVPSAIYELMEFMYSLLTFSKLSYNIIKFKSDIKYERYNLFLPSVIWAKKLF